LKNYKINKIKELIYHDGIEEVEDYFKIAFDISLDEFTDEFKVKIKDYPKSYYLIAIYFYRIFDYNFLKYDTYFKEFDTIIDEVIDTEYLKHLDLFKVQLSLKADDLIRKNRWPEFNNLYNDIKFKTNNSLNLIDNYIKSLDIYQYEKYKWIVDKNGLENTRNSNKYFQPHLDLLFPTKTKEFLLLVQINIIQVLINQAYSKFKQINYLKDKVSFFEENSAMASIFFDKKNVLFLNEYFKDQKENAEKFNNAFFNRVLYILLSSKLDGKDIIKPAKRFRTRYREEIERVFNLKIKIDVGSTISTELVENDFKIFSEKFKSPIILTYI